MASRIAIIGAGPIGIETALEASLRGYPVVVYERGRVGTSLRDWGHVTLFSPWAMNVSSAGLSILGSRTIADPSALVTGRQLVQEYLEPLSQSAELAGKIKEGMTVVHVGRDGLTRTDLIGSKRRLQHPFRLLVRAADGREIVEEADVVIDASGVWGNANPTGNGGIPAPGEMKYRDRISYGLEDFASPDAVKRYAGARVLVVGAGHSAATTLCGLGAFIDTHPATHALWVTRKTVRPPFAPIPDDPLPYRARVLQEANRLVFGGRGIEHRGGHLVEAISAGRSRGLAVTLRHDGRTSVEEVDYIISNCGFGPDNTIYRELQVHECWATRGPMKLSAALLGESATDCLAQTTHGAETLVNPEPGFFIIGNKSYGRLSNFLLKIGREQITEVFSLIEQGASAMARR